MNKDCIYVDMTKEQFIQWLKNRYPYDPTPEPEPDPFETTKLKVQTTSSYTKFGIYSAQRDDETQPIVIDWGDGEVESVNEDVSQKVHDYAKVGEFEVTISNIKTFAASASDPTWYNATSQNRYTLNEVIISSSVISIVDSAFRGCRALASVTIPDGVTSIGQYVFYSCNGLTSVMVGNDVEYIGKDAFKNCDILESITFLGKNLAQVQAIEDGNGNTQYPWGITNTDIIIAENS